ncbi:MULTISPECIES: AraC family transcriptional regulator [Sphingopyxis]|uniref:AraC family transcriptional regulator n=1 Tax=Sphingopyxis TaxID=165697 RepID=UPI001C2BDEAC|nr:MULTISPECIES: AraC family transcriptional regulator [Sphingopyxis]
MIYATLSMVLSQSSKTQSDPLSDVFGVLGAQVTRRTRMEAAGRWAFAFPAVERLKFVAVLRGSQWILLPGCPPQPLNEGDVCLLGRTAYAVASHPNEKPRDGGALYAIGSDVAHVGGDDVIGIGGSVTFGAGNADFLLDMFPTCMIVPRSSPGAEAVTTILDLINSEFERDRMGSQIVTARLADVLVVEAIRAYASQIGGDKMGWFRALTDARIGRALRAMHGDVARHWTVASLAKVAGMSRAGFSAEFSRIVGQPPLTYLRLWRLTLARAALLNGDVTVASIANRIGYTSQSAFGNAFRRSFGVSPKARSRLKEQHS